MKRQSRRTFLKNTSKAAVGISLFQIGHSWAKDAYYDGQPFDAGGEILHISGWGGFWEDLMRKLVLDEFERTYNCKIIYDPAFPWAGKYISAGEKNPPFAVSNWNLPEMFTVSEAGDYFLPQEEIIPNLPNIKDCWPFALSNGVGVTWAFLRLCYAYHNSLGDAKPTSFVDFWEQRFEGQRLSVIPQNDIFKSFFMTTAAEFGDSQRDYKAAISSIKKLMPLKQVKFSRDAQLMVEKNQVKISIQADAEVFASLMKGQDVGYLLWGEQKTILTQTKTISKYTSKTQKLLSYALLNTYIGESFQEKFISAFPLRPMNANVKVPASIAQFGINNTFEETDGLWIPNWVWWQEHEKKILADISDVFVDA